ncbi:MAG TPA: hypothetical protein DIC34_16755 [Treponema sp.]|nr:MAG: hypothetical protein A2Y36_01470 [Treponema sp. GWA1_62_8]OHE68310.1 MAG: hypothetical protein A2001_18925 [Treponema sp. GWC1_61_84]OHE70432.1 MAG: hypothetical protein A2413_18200 [Treponema sp. RIFOXYC1_FULL_61_9]HCM28157.1 hypothetical protein [Treponema sp.]
MKRIFVIVALAVLGSGLYAESPKEEGSSFGAADLLEQVPGIGSKTASELTLAERAKLADALSIARQERMYIGRAAVASFFVPGLGQIMIGKPLEGSLRLVAQAALIGGTMAGAHYLLPDGFDSLLGDRSAMRDFAASGNMVELLPSWGVMAGGMTLALLNAVFSSQSAAAGARDNVDTGRVRFAPSLMYSSGRMGMGLGFWY